MRSQLLFLAEVTHSKSWSKIKDFPLSPSAVGSYFLHSNPSLRAAVHPQLNIGSHLFHTCQSRSCTELEQQRCSIPGQQMQELPQNFNPGKALIASNSNELGSNEKHDKTALVGPPAPSDTWGMSHKSFTESGT